MTWKEKCVEHTIGAQGLTSLVQSGGPRQAFLTRWHLSRTWTAEWGFVGRREMERARQGYFSGKAHRAWAWLGHTSLDPTALSLNYCGALQSFLPQQAQTVFQWECLLRILQ